MWALRFDDVLGDNDESECNKVSVSDWGRRDAARPSSLLMLIGDSERANLWAGSTSASRALLFSLSRSLVDIIDFSISSSYILE